MQENNEDIRIPIENCGYLQEGVSVAMVAGQRRMYFKDIVNLRNTPEYDIQIKAIETFGVDVIPLDPENRVVATETCIRNSFITLCIHETQYKQQEPLIYYATQYNDGLLLEQDLFNVNWEKTYIEVNDPTLLTADGVYYFSILYNKTYK